MNCHDRLLTALESIVQIAALRDENKPRLEGLFELLRDAAGTATAALTEVTGEELSLAG